MLSPSEDVNSFDKVPISALSDNTIEFLTSGLNQKIEFSKRDKHVSSSNSLDENEQVSEDILKKWILHQPSASLAQLRNFIITIYGSDVCDATQSMFIADANQYNLKSPENKNNLPKSRDQEILTIQDYQRLRLGLSKANYDVLVLYASSDSSFAESVIQHINKSGFTVFVKNRDLLGGIPFEHEAVIHIICRRVNKVIIIMSPSFLLCPMNIFYVNFAQKMGIENDKRKIVPCLLEHCEIPIGLQIYYFLDYKRHSPSFFWKKLLDSIKHQNEKELIPDKPASIKENHSDNQCSDNQVLVKKEKKKKFSHWLKKKLKTKQ